MFPLTSCLIFNQNLKEFHCKIPQHVAAMIVNQHTRTTQFSWNVLYHQVVAEPSPESFQQGGFAFVRGGMTF